MSISRELGSRDFASLAHKLLSVDFSATEQRVFEDYCIRDVKLVDKLEDLKREMRKEKDDLGDLVDDIIYEIEENRMEPSERGAGSCPTEDACDTVRKYISDFIKQYKEEQVNEQMNGYNFKTSSPAAVDWTAILGDCTRQNPLLLVEVDHDLTPEQKETREKIKSLEIKIKALNKTATKLGATKVLDADDTLNEQLEETLTDIETTTRLLRVTKTDLSESIKGNKSVFLAAHLYILHKMKLLLDSGYLTDDDINFEEIGRQDNCSIIKVQYGTISTMKSLIEKVQNAPWPNALSTDVKVKTLL